MKFSSVIKIFPCVLFLYHLSFAWFGWQYVLGNNGDALRYWFVGEDLEQVSWDHFLQPGTDVIKLLTFPFVKFLHLPFWTGFVLFSTLSYIGLYQLWLIIRKTAAGSRLLLLVGSVLLLLPNLHVWTGLIGKEAVLFVALTTIIKSVMNAKIKWLTLALSVLVIALIRPHVAFIIVLALVIALLWKGRLNGKQKGLVLLAMTTFFFSLYVLLRKIAYLGVAPGARLLHIYEYHIAGLKKTAAYVPLDQYPLPYKIFTFYFRPLPFEKAGWLYQIWSFENALLFILCFSCFYRVLRYCKRIHWRLFEIFALLGIVLLSLMYVYAYANYGLIARTKIMAMPFLYILLLRVGAQLSLKNYP